MALRLPFQKASQNPPPKPHKINGRIHKIRPFQKVWVQELQKNDREEENDPLGVYRP